MTMRVHIVDDEMLVRSSVRRFLSTHDVEIVAESGDGASAVEAIRTMQPDIVLLDMQMPVMNGMEVIGAIGESNMPATIVLSAFEQYAIRAFEFRVTDYLLKPFGRDRFDKAFSRALEWAEMRRSTAPRGTTAEPHMAPAPADRISVPLRHGRILLLETKDIQWVESAGNLLRIHAGGNSYELRETLNTLQQKLDPRYFLRIHRSTLVNVRYVREVQPWVNGQHILVMRNGQSLRMSRYQRDTMLKLTGRSA